MINLGSPEYIVRIIPNLHRGVAESIFRYVYVTEPFAVHPTDRIVGEAISDTWWRLTNLRPMPDNLDP